MTWLHVIFIVVGSMAAVAALVHFAQAALLRHDPTHGAIAFACLGFALFDLGVGFSHTRSFDLLVYGSVGLGQVIVSAFVPMTAWTLLERPFTRGRLLIVIVLSAAAFARMVELVLNTYAEKPLTWEETLRTPLALPGGLAALGVAVVWCVASARSKAPYARAMLAFGTLGVLASLQGLAAQQNLIDQPVLFGLAAMPFVAFVNTLMTLRHVDALRNAHLPSGDLDRYQVLEQLGSGGMGDVFRARRRGPAGFMREVVVKTLRPRLADPVAKDRFLSEARVAAQLRHPNIVDVYDLGEQADGFFIVMERIEGPNLGEAMRASEAMGRHVPPDAVAELGVQLCRALDYAHAAHVIHRDLKPQNMMVSFAGVVKLIDFGIATERPLADEPLTEPQLRVTDAAKPERLTDEKGVVGTHGYIAPERMRGGPASVATDLFALGVVLYQLLAGRLPFPQRGSPEMLAAVEARDYPKLDALRPDCPPALADAIAQCLEAEPARRPPGAGSLLAMLEHAVSGRRVDLVAWVAGLFPTGDVPTRATAPTTPMQAATVTSTMDLRVRR